MVLTAGHLGSACLHSYFPAAAADDSVSSRSNPTAPRSWRKNAYSSDHALDLGSGAPGTSLSVAHQSRTHTATSKNFCIAPEDFTWHYRHLRWKMDGLRRGFFCGWWDRLMKDEKFFFRLGAYGAEAIARARDFSDNVWIAFAAAEASRRRQVQSLPARNLARKISAYCANEQDHQYTFV
jgi:hypothetical protein